MDEKGVKLRKVNSQAATALIPKQMKQVARY